MNNAFLFKELMQQWTAALLWIKIALCWMEGPLHCRGDAHLCLS